jgi:hypothetical protein
MNYGSGSLLFYQRFEEIIQKKVMIVENAKADIFFNFNFVVLIKYNSQQFHTKNCSTSVPDPDPPGIRIDFPRQDPH